MRALGCLRDKTLTPVVMASYVLPEHPSGLKDALCDIYRKRSAGRCGQRADCTDRFQVRHLTRRERSAILRVVWRKRTHPEAERVLPTRTTLIVVTLVLD